MSAKKLNIHLAALTCAPSLLAVHLSPATAAVGAKWVGVSYRIDGFKN